MPPVPIVLLDQAGVASSSHWQRPVLTLAVGLVFSEAVAHLAHVDTGSLLALSAMAGGWWLLSRRRSRLGVPLPADLDGRFERCEAVLARFEHLEGGVSPAQLERCAALEQLREHRERRSLRLALAGCRPPGAAWQPRFAQALRCAQGLALQWGHALPQRSASWRWPAAFVQADLLLFHLQLPLTAVDLRWLEALPQQQPVWLLLELPATSLATAPVTASSTGGREALQADLASQWPALVAERCLFWDGQDSELEDAVAPLVAWLGRSGASLPAATTLRCLEQLHQGWQAELEEVRRAEWRQLQQRTQWLVAAGVFAAPLPSLDLLVLAAANGLMLQEMARLWDCPWSPELLREAAIELGRAALALGVVEWSSQALAAAIKLHGATWLMGGTLQALSAAYLTRVVGHAMADVLALSSGVSEPDLEVIRRQAPLLVARAAEQEKLDWSGFLQQGRRWWQQQSSTPSPV